MELDHASDLIERADDAERTARATRLVELSDLLNDEHVALHGQAAEWLFEDVKATWLYGYFTGTVLTAYAFCVQQLAGLIRMHVDDPELPDDTTSLEALAGIAGQHNRIDIDLRARLVQLHDSATLYLTASPSTYRRQLERHTEDAEQFTNEHALLTSARAALVCCLELLRQLAP